MILFVRNFGKVLANLFEVLLDLFIQIQEDIHHFVGWEGMGRQNYEQTFCEQIGIA